MLSVVYQAAPLWVVTETCVTVQVSSSRLEALSDFSPALLNIGVTIQRTLLFCDMCSLRHLLGTGSLGQPLHLEARKVTVNSTAAVARLPLACSVGDCGDLFLAFTPPTVPTPWSILLANSFGGPGAGQGPAWCCLLLWSYLWSP